MKTMKTVVLALLLMISGAIIAQNPRSGETVYLQVADIDPTGGDGGYERGPVRPLVVTLDVHTLFFYHVGYDMTLVLFDEDNEVAYTTFVPAHTPSIILPHWLDGDYEIKLFPGGYYYFYGWIEL